jgi:hypothetical protein
MLLCLLQFRLLTDYNDLCLAAFYMLVKSLATGASCVLAYAAPSTLTVLAHSSFLGGIVCVCVCARAQDPLLMAYVNLKLTTAGAEPVKSSSKELQVSQRG